MTGTRTRKRYANTLPAPKLSSSVIAAEMALPGNEGGMSADPVDIDAELLGAGNAGEVAIPGHNPDQLARADLKELRIGLRGARKRRASPPWSLPLEIWHMLLLPWFTGPGVQPRTGVGEDPHTSSCGLRWRGAAEMYVWICSRETSERWSGSFSKTETASMANQRAAPCI